MDEKLESAVNVAAKAAGMDAEDFIEAVFRYRKKEYELEVYPRIPLISVQRKSWKNITTTGIATSIIGAISVTHTQGYVDFDKFL